METGNLIWLIAGIGIGLVLAMGLFAGLWWLELRWVARRLRSARGGEVAPAAGDRPKAAVTASSLIAPVSRRSDTRAAGPPAPPISALRVEPAGAASQSQRVPHETQSVEPPASAATAERATASLTTEPASAAPPQQKEVAIEPAKLVADGPGDVEPEAPRRVGIQAAVAEAAARRRAARQAGLLPEVPPPVVPAAPSEPGAATPDAPSVNVEELFEKAFGTAMPPVADAGADDSDKAS